MSNPDILKAIQELTSRSTSLEQNISKNTADILSIKENVEGMDHWMKTTNEKIHAIRKKNLKIKKKRYKKNKIRRLKKQNNSRCWISQ